MPVPRWRHLANDVAQVNDAATYSLDLPKSGNLHSLLVRAGATNGATSGHTVTALDVVDSLRVVGDGDFRYFNLTSQELEKWMECLLGQELHMMEDEQAGAEQWCVFPIMFGRSLFDPSYFLPLSRVKNPRLEIPYSPTIAADLGFATGTTTIDVMALWTPEEMRMPYAGTLCTRTIKDFTSLASGEDFTEVDDVDPIRAIGVYAYEANTEDGTDITTVRLEANSGDFDIFNGDWDNFLEMTTYENWANITHRKRLFAQDNDVFDVRLGRIRSVQITRTQADDVGTDVFGIISIDARTGDRLTLNASQADITAGAETHVTDSTDRLYYVEANGDTPGFFGLMSWMQPDVEQGYLKPSDYDKLRVILTQGGAGATVRIATQILKTLRQQPA